MSKETAQNPKITVVDSDESVASLMRAVFEEYGFIVKIILIEQMINHPNPEESLLAQDPNLILLELSKGASGSVSLFEKVIGSQRIMQHPSRLLLTSTTPEMVRRIAGDREIISRPFELDQLVDSVYNRLQKTLSWSKG